MNIQAGVRETNLERGQSTERHFRPIYHRFGTENGRGRMPISNTQHVLCTTYGIYRPELVNEAVPISRTHECTLGIPASTPENQFA